MRKYNYKVHIRGINADIKFNCSSITFINKYIRKFIRDYDYRFDLVIRNYHTNDIIQDCSLYRDFSILNRINCSFKLVKHNNNYYFVNHEKNKIC